jgi:phosphoserine / homoserine phosphotransferase
MEMICLDLEGVLIPEIWIKFAEKTGIPELRLTTRDVPDYDLLMKRRLQILADHKLGLKEIQEVIATVEPLPGAQEFMRWVRQHFQVAILSDTYYEFVMPLMPLLSNPMVLCHRLEVNAQGRVVDYVLRQKDPKTHAVKAFHSLNYRVLAAGDSYNDTGMLAEADAGFLFHAPPNIIAEFPQFPAVHTYEELKAKFIEHSQRKLG